MKYLKFAVLALFISGVFSACVSSKKYKEAMASQDSRYIALQTSYQNLQNENQALKSERDRLSSEATNKQASLTEKERMLSQEEQRMRDMKALVDAQRDAIKNLKQEVCSALKCFTPDELSIEVRDGKLYVSLSDKLLFPSGSDVVNPRGKEAISMLAAVLANSDLEIDVEGHTDNVPIHTAVNRDNWDLSVRRATSVSRIMIDNGIPAERIIASGRGEYHPVATNASSSGRQSNRRTEIVLAPKLDKLWKLTEQPDISTSSK